MKMPHYFVTDTGDDLTARPDDPDLPYRTMTAIIQHCIVNEIAAAVVMEWRLDRWHQVGG